MKLIIINIVIEYDLFALSLVSILTFIAGVRGAKWCVPLVALAALVALVAPVPFEGGSSGGALFDGRCLRVPLGRSVRLQCSFSGVSVRFQCHHHVP